MNSTAESHQKWEDYRMPFNRAILGALRNVWEAKTANGAVDGVENAEFG